MRIKKTTFILGTLLVAFSSVSLYYLSSRHHSGIYAYRIKQDLPFVLDLFKQNWYWLVREGSTFDPVYTFTHLSPTRSPHDHGKVVAQVYWHQEKPAGFIAYYLKNFYEGYVWFLVVREEFRGKGISEKLFRYALDDLKKRGARRVWVTTRLNNVKAQNLYKKLGFNEFWRDDAVMNLEKNLTA